MMSDEVPSIELDQGALALPRLAGDELVRLSDVRVRYNARQGVLAHRRVEVLAVDGVSFSVHRGRSLGLVGETGSGKSTIAKVVMRMEAPSEGSVRVGGHDLADINRRDLLTLQRRVQVALQDPYSSLDPRMKVRDIIAEPLTLGRPVWSRTARRSIDERVVESLSLVGIPSSKLAAFPHQFSGGQRQRIAIARALAPQPDLIILDEPTSALDVSVRAQILNLLKSLQDQLGVTYLVISHDLVSVAYLAAEVGVMREGRLVEIGPTTDIYHSPQHAYTKELLASSVTAGAIGPDADPDRSGQSG